MTGLLAFYLSTLLKLAPMLVCVGVGYGWGKKNHPFAVSFVSVLVTSVTTPALVFQTLVTTQLDNQMLAEVTLAAVTAFAIAALLSLIGLRVLGMPVRTLFQSAWIPNAGNLGLPISQLAFGDAGLSAAIAIFAISSLMSHTIGVRVLTGTSGTSAWRNPVLLASLAAVVVRVFGIGLPDWLLESVRMLGSVTVPMMLLSLGHALSGIPFSGVRAGAILAGLRLCAGLVAGYLTTRLLGLEGLLAGVLTLQMAMPVAVNSYMFARRYSDQGDTSAGAVLVSTAVFVLAAPVLIWMTRTVL